VSDIQTIVSIKVSFSKGTCFEFFFPDAIIGKLNNRATIL